MWTILFWIAVAYLAVGVVMTIILSQTPYAENSWIASTLFWPLFFVFMFS